MKWIVCSIGFLFSVKSFGQVPAMIIPEYKHGQDTLFLDDHLIPCDREISCYYALTFFYLDKDVWSPKFTWRKTRRVITTDCPAGDPGKPVSLHGTFKWTDKKYETLYVEEHFTNGHNSGVTKFFDKKGQVTVQYDYDKRFQQYSWSYYREDFKDGELIKGTFWYFDTTKYVWTPVEAFTK